MQSPYFNGGGGGANFGPPPGLAAILAQRDEALQKAGDQIGSFAGGIGGGIAGATQGAADPGVFGDGTSSASGAGQGFLRNFAVGSGQASGGGGGGGGGMSGFASLVNGGGNGGGGGAGGGGGMPNLGGMTVKQLQAAGKTADAFRNQMAAGTPTTGDEDPKILGTTADEWSTLGAQDKWGKVSGYVQAQAQKSVMQQMAAQAVQTQQAQQQVAAEQANANAWQMAAGQIRNRTLAQGNGPVNPPGPGLQDWANAAAAYAPDAFNSRAAMPYLQEMAGRWRDKTSGLDAPSATFQQDPVTGARFLQVGKQVLTSGYDPEALKRITSQPLLDGDGNPTGVAVIPHPNGKGFQIIKPTADGTLAPVRDPLTQEAIPGMGIDKSGKKWDNRTMMQKLGVDAGGGGVGGSKIVTPDVAAKFLKDANGDKVEARKAAKKAGYTY